MIRPLFLFAPFFLLAFFVQSTLFYNSHFSFFHVKPNLTFVIALLAAVSLPPLPAVGFLLFAGFLMDHASSAPTAFYLFSFFFSLLPVQIFRSSFSFQVLPVFMLMAMATSFLKAVLEGGELVFFMGWYSAFSYLKNVAFLEIVQNTLLSAPVLLIYLALSFLFRKLRAVR